MARQRIQPKARPNSQSSLYLSSPQRLTEKEILDLMQVPSFPNVYFVGKNSRRVSFVAQQIRALNLLWALQRNGDLYPGSRVLIIGAGLAGLTASIASAALEFHTRVIERRGELLHLQVGNAQRFIHPKIADWPKHGSTRRETELPCLNWSADIAGKVAETIEQSWRRAQAHFSPLKIGFEAEPKTKGEPADSYDVHLQHHAGLGFTEDTRLKLYNHCEVTDITYTTNADPTPVVSVVDRTDATQIMKRIECDVVIVCCGFGLEQHWKKVGFLSYWDNDNLVRAILSEPIPRNVLVTGIGDGGLTDAMRACLQSVSHQNIIQHLTGIKLRIKLDRQRPEFEFEKHLGTIPLKPLNFSLQRERENAKGDAEQPPETELTTMLKLQLKLEARLDQIEQNAEAIMRLDSKNPEIKRRLTLWKKESKEPTKENEKNAIELIKESIVSQFIFDRYLELKQDEELKPLIGSIEDLIQRHMRKDVSVLLNGEAPTPMTLRSMPVNRFGVFLLMQKGILQYQQGKAELSETSSQNDFLVHFRPPLLMPYVPDKAMIFQQVIVRHGVDSPLKQMFGETLAQELTKYTGEKKYDLLATALFDKQFGAEIESGIAATDDESEKDWKFLEDNYARLLEGFVKDLQPKNTNDLRATIWRPYPTLQDRRLIMMCPYKPHNQVSRFAKAEISISTSKGMLGLSVAKKKPLKYVADPSDDEIDYKIALIRDFRFSSSDIELMDQQRKVCFSYPVVAKKSNGKSTVLAVLWCDFATVQSFQKCEKTILNASEKLAQALCRLESSKSRQASETHDLQKFSGHWNKLGFIDKVEIYSEVEKTREPFIDCWNVESEADYCLESHWRPEDEETPEEQMICLLRYPPKQKETSVQADCISRDQAAGISQSPAADTLKNSASSTSKIPTAGTSANVSQSCANESPRHIALLVSKPKHQVGDILRVKGVGPIGRVVKVNQPVESLPQASLRDKTAYPNHALVTFVEILSSVKMPSDSKLPAMPSKETPRAALPPEDTLEAIPPKVKTRVSVVQTTGDLVGSIRALDCSIEASYSKDIYWFDDVFEIRLTDDSGKKESLEGGIVYSMQKSGARVLGTVVWSSADVVYAFPLSSIVKRLNMDLIWEFPRH